MPYILFFFRGKSENRFWAKLLDQTVLANY